MKAALVVVALVAVAGVGLLGVRLVSARTAENGCVAVAERRGYSQVSYSWSWWPLGTECTFDDGASETRLIW